MLDSYAGTSAAVARDPDRARPHALTARALAPARVAAGVVGVVGVGLGVALALRPLERLGSTPVTEDGFYALSVSRNVAAGNGISVDGVLPTSGFQPLRTFLDAPLFALAGADRVAGLRLSLLLSTLIWVAFAVLMAYVARDRARRHGLDGRPAALLAALVVLGSVSVLRTFHNGLETGLQLLLLAAAVLAADRIGDPRGRAAVLLGVLFGALCWARLDGVLFVVCFAAVTTLPALRRGTGRRPSPWPLVACAVAALIIAPWLVRNLGLEGSLVPSSGRAQSGAADPLHNLGSGLRAAGAWALPPVGRPHLHAEAAAGSYAIALLGLAVLGAAVAALRRRTDALHLGPGTRALWLFAGVLFAYYTLGFASWWFLDRYLAPLLVLTLPWLAAAGEGLLGTPRRVAWAVPALATLIVLANAPVAAVALAAPPRPPDWAAPRTNLGAHVNDNFFEQTAWAMRHVRPSCRVGAMESGTLGYFYARTVNLDGKVDPAALRALRAGQLRRYVDAARVDVVVSRPVPTGISLGETRPGFALAGRAGDFEAWVRRGAEGCLR